MDKKSKARHEMLKHLSKNKSSDMYKGIGEDLKAKRLSKMQKVTVMAPDEKSLKKGLSKAQQILAAKLGNAENEEDLEESLEECPICDGHGCKICREDEESEEEELSDEE